MQHLHPPWMKNGGHGSGQSCTLEFECNAWHLGTQWQEGHTTREGDLGKMASVACFAPCSGIVSDFLRQLRQHSCQKQQQQQTTTPGVVSIIFWAPASIQTKRRRSVPETRQDFFRECTKKMQQSKLFCCQFSFLFMVHPALPLQTLSSRVTHSTTCIHSSFVPAVVVMSLLPAIIRIRDMIYICLLHPFGVRDFLRCVCVCVCACVHLGAAVVLA
mmetsp:Transcript_56778/g.93404  ORF Transcript_56778/g.93404 Transcript_56778/m.93404 type:complete len:216 (-) Transcript_56778:1120-1767(-)